MAIDSRAKGRTAETKARDELRKATGLKWERTPGSGALDEKHGLKGDLYIPQEKNKFCVEVKHYKDDHLNSKILYVKDPQIFVWWEQTVRQGVQTHREPLLLFKYDRSKWFCGWSPSLLQVDAKDKYKNITRYMLVRDNKTSTGLVLCLLEDFTKWKSEPQDWIHV